jgi:WD40 repeat protein
MACSGLGTMQYAARQQQPVYHFFCTAVRRKVHVGKAAVLQPLFSLQGHYEPIAAIAMLPHPGQLLSSDHSGLLIFWDYVTQKATRKFQHSCTLLCLAPRADKPEEILLGTSEGDILRLPAAGTGPVRSTATDTNSI